MRRETNEHLQRRQKNKTLLVGNIMICIRFDIYRPISFVIPWSMFIYIVYLRRRCMVPPLHRCSRYPSSRYDRNSSRSPSGHGYEHGGRISGLHMCRNQDGNMHRYCPQHRGSRCCTCQLFARDTGHRRGNGVKAVEHSDYIGPVFSVLVCDATF